MRLSAVAVAALQFLQPSPLPQIGDRRIGDLHGLPFRQRLENYHNVQYHTMIQIGGQNVSGIMDTGSFEIVVVSTRCGQCPDPEYNHSESRTYVDEGTIRKHTYGSGPTRSRMGYEHISVGPLVAWNLTFYEILDHNISALDDASFDAIVGIGGAGEPDQEHESLLEKLHVQEYSVCLEPGDRNPGWLTWGGDLPTASRDRSWSLEMPVIGEHHWAVALTGVYPVGLDLPAAQQDAAGTLLCRDGCAAVLDSGTSLIAAPSYALQGLAFIVPQVHENCSNFEDMPTLELHLGGRRVLLPPEAYVFRLTGTLAEAQSVWEILHFKPKIQNVDECVMAFMPMDRRTAWGPLWIFGMPFFRTYHVQFDAREAQRRVWVSNQDADCMPQPLEGESVPGDITDDKPFPDMQVFKQVRRHAPARPRAKEPLTIPAKALLPPRLSLPL